MSNDTERPLLGECPVCAGEVPVEKLAVTYRPEDGWPRMLAECPDCGAAVHPE